MTKTVIAIGAHPDDIEIGCTGTLLNYSGQNCNIYYIIASLGEKCNVKEKDHSRLIAMRKKESKQAASFVKVKDIFFLMLPDTNIDHNGLSVVNLEKYILKIKPDLIFTHTLQDNHQDHKNIGYSTISACRRSKSSILHYETPSTAQSFLPVIYSDISNSIDKKIEILKCFTSQNEKKYLESDAIIGLARYRGYTSGSRYAEAFEVSRWFI